MSIVFPCRRRDFLAPSKALQELKAKLGPIYFDAKLIECPQNAVELGKLLQKYEELDKQKFKKLSETSREQRILQNSLSSRHINEPSTVSLLSRGSSTGSFVDVAARNAPPPGFRFHANGDPKSEGIDALNDFAPDSRTSIFSRASTRDSNMSTITEGDFRDGRYEDDFDRDEATPTGIKSRDPEYEEIDYSKEIEDLELLILQLEAQLNSSKSDKSSTGADVDQPKRNYLRAHSHSEDMLESCINRPSANYVYDPDQKHKRDRRPINPMFGQGFQSDVKRSAKCLACQFKLKHVGNEFSKHRAPDVLKARWNAAPSGCFISAPNISTTSTMSLHSSRLASKSSLTSRKSSTPRLSTTSVSHQNGRSSSVREADRTDSQTTTKASNKDLIRARSGASNNDLMRTSSKASYNDLMRTSSKASNNDLMRTSSKASNNDLMWTSSKASNNDLMRASSKASNNDLMRASSKASNNDLMRASSKASNNDLMRTSSKASNNDLMRTSSKASNKDIMRTSSKASNKDLMRTSSKVSNKNLMRTSSKASNRDLMRASSKASNRDLIPAASSPSCGSPILRFISPLQRESRIQMLKSQAEQEVRDCQEKVDTFLCRLESCKSLTRSKH